MRARWRKAPSYRARIHGQERRGDLYPRVRCLPGTWYPLLTGSPGIRGGEGETPVAEGAVLDERNRRLGGTACHYLLAPAEHWLVPVIRGQYVETPGPDAVNYHARHLAG